jgi:transcriptional regulator with XRE-family HTH domain
MGMDTHIEKQFPLTDEEAKRIQIGGRGIEFRILRKRADLTLNDAAKELKKMGDPISRAMLSIFERGQKDLRPATLERLEEIYKVPPEQRKENAARRESETAQAAAQKLILPWLRKPNMAGTPLVAEEPKTESAKLAAAHSKIELLQVEISQLKRMNAALQQGYDEAQKLLRSHTQPAGRRSSSFYGE